MQARLFASILAVAAGLAGCTANPAATPGPAYLTEMNEGRPGLFGELRWDIDFSGKEPAATRAGTPAGSAAAPATAAPMTAAEQEDFKKWQESAGRSERQEFEEWRAWQEWKRKNPK